ncbi:MAG TPA: phosphoribosylformylglycinamidine synthase subunit PurS [Gemmatimonadaceae bacterium]|nr:phosphoribosylformylglycinamidine synthase subunit PurS [Gemmatimonadaceae bacterium]
MKTWKVSVHITPRRGILDPQGKAVEGALHSLGFETVRDVHVGRHIIIENEAQNAEEARTAVKAMCERLLANPVIEDFEIESADER